jgi:ketosteroid isomerase-like protein
MDRAAAQMRDGEPCRYELISQWVGRDVAGVLEVQATWARVAGTEARVALRVTTIFRLEDGEWKVVHRHADPLSEQRSLESIAT